MKYINFLLFLVFPCVMFGQVSGDFKFDNSSVTFPDGTVQNTAASPNAEATIPIPPDEYRIEKIRASFTGIIGSAPETDFEDHVIITGLDFTIDTDNNLGYTITPSMMKFTKGNDIASVDLLDRLKNDAIISEVNFKVIILDGVGSNIVIHEFILANAKVVKAENKISYEETKGFFFKETYTLSFSDIDIRNSIGNQETESFNVPR